ncbi:MAG: deoxyribose-phosphate aldolase [Treponema sp.]|nr:deoxyribose-phosphate aldolase [Treponema sp.]
MTKTKFASYIDHTLLAPNATVKQISQLCQEALSYGFASVCVNPVYVGLAASKLADTPVKVCTVIGFPLGASTTAVKVFEASNAINNGADEIDMVLDIGAAKDGRFSELGADIAAVVSACKSEGQKLGKDILVKVILETCLLSDTEVITSCQCAIKAGADFVKTSTGFANPKSLDGNSLPNGASEYHVKLMRKTVGDALGVKASGGIRSVRTAITMLEAGASRIGTSSGVALMENWDESARVRANY